MRSLILMTLIAIMSGLMVSHFQINVSFSDIKDYCSVLILVSGMIFTIMGIWIAFIYPNAIKKLSDPTKIEIADFSDTLNDTRRLESIVDSIMASGFVAIVIALMLFLKIILSPIQSLVNYHDLMMSAAFG